MLPANGDTVLLRGLQFLIIDDGSTDGTPEVAEREGDVRYIRQENRGAAAARNG